MIGIRALVDLAIEDDPRAPCLWVPSEHWQDEPEEHDFLAATDYLSLLFADGDAAAIAEELRNAPAIRREGRAVLPRGNGHLPFGDSPGGCNGRFSSPSPSRANIPSRCSPHAHGKHC